MKAASSAALALIAAGIIDEPVAARRLIVSLTRRRQCGLIDAALCQTGRRYSLRLPVMRTSRIVTTRNCHSAQNVARRLCEHRRRVAK